MDTKTTDSAQRSKVAEACIRFGSHLLSVRISSVTPDDAQECIKSLFQWFSDHQAFGDANAGIAVEAIEFGKELLENRKTATVQESVDAIQSIYKKLAETDD